MKKFILTFLLMISVLSVSAQIYTYRTTDFAIKKVNSYGNWTQWSDWEPSDMVMTINLNNDVVKIYSPSPQTYTITDYVRNYTDNSGGRQMEFRFIDQDYDRGTMRLRIERNGNSQVYIEFTDVIWVYNVRRVR